MIIAFIFWTSLGMVFEIPKYNVFNSKLSREDCVELHPVPHVTYMPLAKMNATEPDTMLTTMKLVKSQKKQGNSIQCSQMINNYSKYQLSSHGTSQMSGKISFQFLVACILSCLFLDVLGLQWKTLGSPIY